MPCGAERGGGRWSMSIVTTKLWWRCLMRGDEHLMKLVRTLFFLSRVAVCALYPGGSP